MSNKLKRKPKKTIGFTRLESKQLLIEGKREKDIGDIVEKSYKDIRICMMMVLHDRYGFGGKRLGDFSKLLNVYLEKSITDPDMTGSKLAWLLNEKYGINIQHEADKIPFRGIINTYHNKTLYVKKDEVYKLVNAAAYNIFALAGVGLKTKFRMTAKNLKQFMLDVEELYGMMLNKETYSISSKELAQTIYEETKYCDGDFLEVV